MLFDADQVFLQSKLDGNMFLRLLAKEMYVVVFPVKLRLNKSVYRLKQASRLWHAHLTSCLKIQLYILGFGQCLADACVF